MKKIKLLIILLFASILAIAQTRVATEQLKVYTSPTAGKFLKVQADGTIIQGDAATGDFKLVSDSVNADGYTRRDRLASELTKKVSDAVYSSTWDAVTTIAPSKNAIYDKITTLESATYTATTMTVNAGTLVAGTVNDTWAPGGTDVKINEASGLNPLNVTFAFNGVQRLTAFTFYGNYQGGAGHIVYVEAYNTGTTNWDLIGEIGTSTVKQWYSFGMFNSTAYISGGNVQVRFNHQGTGVVGHALFLDYVIVNFGGASGGTSLTASQIAYVPSGNIASTNVQTAITELDTEKKITSITFSATTLTTTQGDGTTASVAVPTFNQSTTGQSGSVANSLIVTVNGGTSDGIDKYTFNGSSAKSFNIVAGSNVSITTTTSTITISATGGTSTATGEIWTSLTGIYSTATAFTFTGTDKDAKLVEMSLFTCTSSDGNTRRIGYVKTATNSSGTITCNVVTDTDLASGDKDFKIAYNRKVTDYMRLVTIPGEQIADASYSQGMFYADIPSNSYLLPVDFSVQVAAAGTGAALTINVYKNTTALFISAPDMTTNTVLRSQRPTTNTISAGETVSLRIMSSAGATNKASGFQAKLYVVPVSLFTAMGMNHFMMLILLLVSLGSQAQIKGYWRFNGNANDASGNGNNGTGTNVTYSSGNGMLNQGALLAVNGKIVFPSAVTGAGANTIVLFVKFIDTNVFHYFLTDIDANSTKGINIVNGGRNNMGIGLSSTGSVGELQSTTNLPAGVWIRAVFVMNGTNSAIYYNGKLDCSGAITVTQNNTNNLRLNGRWATPNSGDVYLNDFYADELIIDSKAWTPADMKNDYAKVKGFF